MQTILQFVVAMDDGKPDEAIAIIKQGDCAIEIQIWIEVYDEDNPQHPLWPQVRPAAIARVEELRPTQPTLPYKPTLPAYKGVSIRPVTEFSILLPAKKMPLHQRFFDWVQNNYGFYMLLCFAAGSILRWYCTGQDINRFISPEPFWPF